MTLFRFLLLVISLYFLYRLVFHLIVPVFMVARKMKQQVRNFNDQMQSGFQETANPGSRPNPEPSPEVKAGEYIDFEEVK